MYGCLCISTRMYMYICTYVRICTHTYAHTHTYTHAFVFVMYMYVKCLLMILNKVPRKITYLGTIINEYLVTYLRYFFNQVIYLLPR